MGVELEEIKARVSLTSLLERDGIALAKKGPDLVACCPFHGEKTPSFVVHVKAGGDWFKCFGCGVSGDIFSYWGLSRGLNSDAGFSQVVEELAAIAGLGGGVVSAPLPRRVVPAAPQDAPVAALDDEGQRYWERACAELYTDRAECERIAAWRGYRVEVVEWAARRGLMGRVLNRGAWREAFVIQRPAGVMESPGAAEHGPAPFMEWMPTEIAQGPVVPLGGVGGLEAIGWHVRLAPRSRSNDADKASWRYEPRKGLGAWPFVILPAGGVAAAKYIFCLEGQWDALAMVELMGWEKQWPAQAAVFGMRGSTSWKRMLEYELRPDAVAFLIADRDAAGAAWFAVSATAPGFVQSLSKRVRYTCGYWPGAGTGKDLNDVVKGLAEPGREAMRMMLRKRIQPRAARPKRGPTFHVWLKAQRSRLDEVGQFAGMAITATSPRGRVRPKVWERHLQGRGVEPAMMEAFVMAWKEWTDTR